MKQVVHRRGRFTVEEVPRPALGDGFSLVRTLASVVSAGTERAIAAAGEQSLARKALARPELVRRFAARAMQDGVATTIASVQQKLGEPSPIGYSAAGEVIEAGANSGVAVGELVACGGAGLANHAELIAVPRHLCAAVPQGVAAEDAAFTTVGAIALHGVRLAELQLGHTVVVIGLGLVGQIAAQVASANGCRVVAIDLIEERTILARQLGADAAGTPADAPSLVADATGGAGADAVLIAADTDSNEPVSLAGELARDRGTVVAIGAVSLDAPRTLYYTKELRLLVSRSYGPGRYDPDYELHGHDYPVAYVRWTEQRNFSAFLDLVARGRVRVSPLVSHRFPIEQAPAAYDLISGRTSGSFLGVVLTYPQPPDLSATIRATGRRASPANAGTPRLAVLGAGAFARSVLVPALKKANATFTTIVSQSGISAKAAAEQFGALAFGTDAPAAMTAPDTDAVVIATRHHLHAVQAIAAGEAGKDVFVEKPLCLSLDELARVQSVFQRDGAPRLMVGFNRRFAPLAAKLHAFFSGAPRPLVIDYRINAGRLPAGHWSLGAEGGGRIVGEACHFLDLAGWLVGTEPSAVTTRPVAGHDNAADDSVVMTIDYQDGSVATITYTAMGAASLPKERLEVHGGGRSAVLDDFRTLEIFREGHAAKEGERSRQDKGHVAECAAWLDALRSGGPSPIPLAELFTTTRLTLLALESARLGHTVSFR